MNDCWYSRESRGDFRDYVSLPPNILLNVMEFFASDELTFRSQEFQILQKIEDGKSLNSRHNDWGLDISQDIPKKSRF